MFRGHGLIGEAAFGPNSAPRHTAFAPDAAREQQRGFGPPFRRRIGPAEPRHQERVIGENGKQEAVRLLLTSTSSPVRPTLVEGQSFFLGRGMNKMQGFDKLSPNGH
jgi:hypothetical protein